MNIYLDCEFNGFKGELLSMAIVAADNYFWHGALLPSSPDIVEPWVKDNVLPVYLNRAMKFNNRETFNTSLRKFLQRFHKPNLCTDWYADLEYFFSCFNGKTYKDSFAYACTTEIKLIDQLKSEIPHNALFDAIALKQQWSEQ